MPSFTNSDFIKPSDDKEFEQMTRDLFAAHWKDENSQVYGRSGQSQDGIDVYGQPNGGETFFGIQCKLRNQGTLSQTDIENEIRKARSFKYKLDTFIFVTTASRDKKTQDLVEKLSQEEQARGGFKIQIRFWEDFCSLLAEHPQLIHKYYAPWNYPIKSFDEPLTNQPLEIDSSSPLLIGAVIDMSSSCIDTINRIPSKIGISAQRINKALALVAEKSIAFCKTPEADDILPLISLFTLGYGFGSIRQTVSSIFKRIGFKGRNLQPDLIPSEPIRDLFAETASKESLPFTPNVASLYTHWQLYSKSVEAQFIDVGFGPSILYDALVKAHQRISKELTQPYYKYPILLIISNGYIDNASDQDINRIIGELKLLNVQIFSLYIGDTTITKNKSLYNASSQNWPTEALRMFNIASPLDTNISLFSSLVDMARENNWDIPENSKLFFQLNHIEMFEELIDIILNPIKNKSSRK
jgi:hypothetical protein